MLGCLGAILLVMAWAYSQSGRYAADLAALSRRVIGDENTARMERLYFALQDRIDQIKYDLFGGSTNPFGESDPEFVISSETPRPSPAHESKDWSYSPAPTPTTVPTPEPMVLPQTIQLSTELVEGEGLWTTQGLPRSSPGDVLMAKTFIRPDKERPYALVGVLLLDKRRIRLNLVAGTEEPGGELGFRGHGGIPTTDLASVLVAWNGGFMGAHGGYGMYADGQMYRPLRDRLATVAVMRDGTIMLGEWGRDLAWSDEIVAARQNVVLLVDNCEVSKRASEGIDTWGYVAVDSTEFITSRSAIGLTKAGDLLVAAGNSLSAEALARALWAAGACYAMQLDINVSYVATALFFQEEDGIRAEKFMDSMAVNPQRFLSSQTRDFMYVTLDESRYLP